MIRRFVTALVFACTFILSGNAQQTFRGIVANSQGQPLDAAVVQLLLPSGKMAGYSLTDAQGVFNITLRQAADSLEVAVSLLGYKSYKQKADGTQLRIRMEEEVIALREVEIRSGRISRQSDTINYNVAQFLSPKDETIKDIIKKLPGLDVSESGKISYNGQDINNFYVEGMDLVGGRYNQITNVLEAKAVESVQVLENHQPVRMLQDKIKSEAVALNLKLKAEFRDRWMATLYGSAGLPPLLWEGSLSALQLSRHSQSAYNYKGNNTGKDITDNQLVFFNPNSGQLREPEVPSFLAQPSLMAPLKKEQLLFNNMHTFSGNRLYKLGENSRLRFNASYTHDERKQERGSQTAYFQPLDTVEVAEESATQLRSDKAELAFDLENNNSGNFLTDRFKVSGAWEESVARFQGSHPFDQRLKTPALSFRNELATMWNRSEHIYEARSLVRYNNLPAGLSITGSQEERLPLNQLYADHSLAFLKKSGQLTQRYTAGINAQASNLVNGFSPYFVPSWQWSRSLWYATFAAPLTYTVFIGKNFSRLAANPSFSLQYRPRYAWRFSGSAACREDYGGITAFRPEYSADYRTTVRNNGILPVEQQQSYSVYGEYKRTAYEFFSSLSLNHTRSRSNYTLEETFDDGQRILTSLGEPANSSRWNLRGDLSKGFYEQGLKLSLSYLFSTGEGEQINRGERLPYRSEYMQYEPKISWTPFRRLEASYQATFRYGGSRVGTSELSPLNNWVQKLQISYELGGIEYNLSGDHYYNDLSRSQSIHAFFADFSLRWKPSKKWQFQASATNLFDKKQYSYTQYSATQSYTSWINIRGREFLLSAQYRF
ncbi:hypothetical protein FACS1894181_07880 [Bacteroidia bacterium]|nr:hypothetical protein FACS1894181_07880 [Bacteroidia bacterium]